MSADRRWTVAAWITILFWCALTLAVRRQSSITDDWQGWRQADTQAIARNFAFEEFNVLRPRIDWRGDGPGYVETEFQLYPAMVAAWMRIGGESIWPGQLISLLATAAAAAIIYCFLSRRFGGLPGYAGLLLTLTCQGVVVGSTSIQPDPLAFLAFVFGFVAFAEWLESPSSRLLAVWVVATMVAGLVKPTTLELGVAQALLVLLAKPSALRRPLLWAGWAVVLAAVGGFLLHARTLYLDYGNTFGILSGGDSKLPSREALVDPWTWINLGRFIVIWGVGIPAIPAALYLAWRRRWVPEQAALAGGAMLLSLLALRYTSGQFGTHYHLPHVVLGASIVALAVAELAPRLGTKTLLVAMAIVAVPLYARAVRYIRALPTEPETVVGRMLADAASPGTLVAVRVRAPRHDEDWDTVNNFEDPRVFYLSRTRGWTITNDDAGSARLAETRAKGARFYAHVNQIVMDRELTDWLAAHAELVATAPQGSVYRLR